MVTRNRWPYYTQRWQRLRSAKLAERPLCESCMHVGRIEVATVVDHRIPINRALDKRTLQAVSEAFPHLDKLASLCAQCHNQKSRYEQLGKKDWFLKGHDAFGYPLDPNHPWNLERNREKEKGK